MLTIHKYTLLPECAIELTEGAKILSVGDQQGTVVMWVLLDTEKPIGKRIFMVFGTGHTLDDKKGTFEYIHLGTVQQESGFVWHVFERILAPIYY